VNSLLVQAPTSQPLGPRLIWTAAVPRMATCGWLVRCLASSSHVIRGVARWPRRRGDRDDLGRMAHLDRRQRRPDPGPPGRQRRGGRPCHGHVRSSRRARACRGRRSGQRARADRAVSADEVKAPQVRGPQLKAHADLLFSRESCMSRSRRDCLRAWLSRPRGCAGSGLPVISCVLPRGPAVGQPGGSLPPGGQSQNSHNSAAQLPRRPACCPCTAWPMTRTRFAAGARLRSEPSDEFASLQPLEGGPAGCDRQPVGGDPVADHRWHGGA
jgi:hypothetical protein